jgi:propionyl-CoA carboxylase alpha chain
MLTNLLVANRGEIAARVFRTARAMGIRTVAVFSDADADAPFVRQADAAVRLPGLTSAETYLRIDRIIDAAKAAGADAVHPGYGFLSENAGFARAVIDAGLVWVGPPPDAIETMGSKLAAKALMQKAGVPTLPWSTDPADAAAVGFPLLVKASAGGGGRGMRVVRDPAELAAAVDAARGEAASAFGDDTVFLERYVEAPRHVEIQVFADDHGNTASLFERECSIQRRHQKIVEEAPSPAVDSALRERMGAAAVAAARAVDYRGAGTVEFVLDADGEFAFLEMNTRLQVEHPVTELVTGLDLVRLQLLVAAGAPLPPEALLPRLTGHAIEVRLYAEDAEAGYLPSTGRLRAFDFDDRVRLDSGVETGSVVSPYYDPMLAKVVAFGASRQEAADVLASALRSARLHGVTTNRSLLVGILANDEFRAGGTDTAFLDRHSPVELVRAATVDGAARLHAVAAGLAVQARQRANARVWGRLPSGWRNNPSQPQETGLHGPAGDQVVRYAFARDGLSVDVDGASVAVDLHRADQDLVDMTVDGVRQRFAVAIDGDLVDVDSPLGAASYTVRPRFPDPTAELAAGSLVAPMPGSVVRVLVTEGDTVEVGRQLVVLEAMKMQHPVVAAVAGRVTAVKAAEGQQVDAGTVLVVIEADNEPNH